MNITREFRDMVGVVRRRDPASFPSSSSSVLPPVSPKSPFISLAIELHKVLASASLALSRQHSGPPAPSLAESRVLVEEAAKAITGLEEGGCENHQASLNRSAIVSFLKARAGHISQGLVDREKRGRQGEEEIVRIKRAVDPLPASESRVWQGYVPTVVPATSTDRQSEEQVNNNNIKKKISIFQ
jgi:hypothetical protein